MNNQPHLRRIWIAYTAFYLIFAAAAARAIFTLWHIPDFWSMIALFAVYLLVMLAEPSLIARNVGFLHGINTIKAGIVLALLLLFGPLDYFALLFLPLCAQSILHFPRRTALYWIMAILLMMIVPLLLRFPLSESIGYVILYPAAVLLISGFCYLAQEAERAQSQAERLLEDLQVANRQLQVYAEQVEELAATNERTRLARELHDSATQIIFGLTLSAQAARMLLDRDTTRAAAQLDHIQVLAQNALTEMRALIQQLHPNPVNGEGLSNRLRTLAVDLQSNDGLVVDLDLPQDLHLPANIEEGLFRIAQEALHNVVKHARTKQAFLGLGLESGNRVHLCIEDRGAGFDSAATRSMPGHLGITSMSERVQTLGGTLRIDSTPGSGTRVAVEILLDREVEHVV